MFVKFGWQRLMFGKVIIFHTIKVNRGKAGGEDAVYSLII